MSAALVRALAALQHPSEHTAAELSDALSIVVREHDRAQSRKAMLIADADAAIAMLASPLVHYGLGS